MITIVVTLSFTDAHQIPAEGQQWWAVLQGDGPSLPWVLTQVAAAGGRDVLLQPRSVDERAPSASWVGRVARFWLAQQSEPQLSVRVDTGQGTPVPLDPRGDGLQNRSWEEVPPARHHLLVCRGPRCHAQGSSETITAISTELERRRLADTEVLLTQTGCLYPCNRAPVVACHPAGQWFGPIHAEDAAELVDAIHRGDLSSLPLVPRA